MIFLSYLSLLVQALLDNVRGPFYPEILADLGGSATKGSLFFAVVSLFAFLGSWRAHALLRRINSITLLGGSALLMSLGYFGLAFSRNFAWMLVACVVYGLAYGGMNLAQNLLICQASEGQHRRRLFSGLHAMYATASLAAPLVASAFRDHGMTWRFSFLVLSVLPLVVVFSCLKWSGGEEGHARIQTATSQTSAVSLSRADWPACLFFSFLLAVYLWGEISISSRFVLWLRTERGFLPNAADTYLALFFLMLVSGRVGFGLFTPRHLGNWGVLFLSALIGGLLYGAGLIWDPRFMVAAGLAMAPFYPVTMDQIARHFGEKSTHALGFVIGFGSLSVVVMHFAIGLINDRLGLGVALRLCAGLMILLAGALLWRLLSPAASVSPNSAPETVHS